MKTIVYIIPAFGATCAETQYRILAQKLHKEGYIVRKVNPDWLRPLSKQTFKPEENSIIIGFSYGAVLTKIIADRYKFREGYLASLSPLHNFSYRELYDDFHEHVSSVRAHTLAADLKSINLKKKTKTPVVYFKGDREEKNIPADFIIKDAGHYLNENYRRSLVAATQ